MKTFASLLLFVLVLGSCSVLKGYSTEGFTIEGNMVHYQGKPMAELSSIEFALDNNKFVREMTFILVNGDNNDKIHNLIAFIHSKHPDYEIEVEIPYKHINNVEKFDNDNE